MPDGGTAPWPDQNQEKSPEPFASAALPERRERRRGERIGRVGRIDRPLLANEAIENSARRPAAQHIGDDGLAPGSASAARCSAEIVASGQQR